MSTFSAIGATERRAIRPAQRLSRQSLYEVRCISGGVSGIEEKGVGSLMASWKDNLREASDSVRSLPSQDISSMRG
jgi:hypothetical protein